MGKTAFALNVGRNIVKKYKIPLIIFTLEMSREQIMYRLISNETNISSSRIKSGKMTNTEWGNLQKTLDSFAELPIYIDDNAHAGISEIRSKIKKILINNNNNQGLVIIDYLQLMKSSMAIDNRVQEISYITRSLKLLAKDLHIPIILLSQLSRSVESRINKRPMLSDLRESGCIVQNDTVYNTKINSYNFENAVWNNNKILNFSKRIDFNLKGIKPTFLLTFGNNITISITGNHKILSSTGWIKISELNPKKKIYSIQVNKKGVTEIKYETVNHIRYEGINPVYDKTVPFFHNYLKNNILCHNSIEQDADVVIMIYRDDYYTKQNDNKKITEFIIAKHRNGPIGTAKLYFSPETSSFRNT
jgi:replicative DNA helicase